MMRLYSAVACGVATILVLSIFYHRYTGDEPGDFWINLGTVLIWCCGGIVGYSRWRQLRSS